MKSAPMYSILIPVYNTSKFLRQCLDSILIQQIGDYEVIIVNDGSTDNSLEICKEYEKKDHRFTVISQENMGLLLTRRRAIKHSKGKYLLFLDSDDFWEPNALEVIDNTIRRYNFLDIIVFNWKRVDETGKFLENVKRDLPYETIFNRNNYSDKIYKILAASDHLNSMWSKVVKREIVDVDNDYQMYKGLSHGEDLLQTLPLLFNSKSLIFVNAFLYNYRSNPKSITNNFTTKSFQDLVCVFKKMLQELNKQDDITNSVLTLFNNRAMGNFLSIVNLISISKMKYRDKRKFLLIMMKDHFFQENRTCFRRKKITVHNFLTKFLLSLLNIKITLPIVLLLKLRSVLSNK